MNTYRVKLHNAQQGCAAINALYRTLKPYLLADHQYELTVTPTARTLSQNAKFHAICTDLAKSKKPHAGKPRSKKQWKQLLISAHAVATNEETELVLGLENEVINIRESTADMSKKRGSSLIEYSLAFCAMNDVRLNAAEYESEPV